MTNDVNLCEAATTVTFVRRRKNIINLGSSFLQIDINSFRLAAPSERASGRNICYIVLPSAIGNRWLMDPSFWAEKCVCPPFPMQK